MNPALPAAMLTDFAMPDALNMRLSEYPGGMSLAWFSACALYRYGLARIGGDRLLPWIMLNPSTADERKDDPTIRRTRWFSEREGYAGVVIANAYALRSTNPAGLWAVDDPVGPENDAVLRMIGSRYPVIVCAWGANISAHRSRAVRGMLSAHGAKLKCLGVTRAGEPKHPLYIAGKTPLIDLPEAA